MELGRIFILANGTIKKYNYFSQLIKEDDFIICANGGTAHAITMNKTPNIIIGDLDSLDENIKNQLSKNVLIIKHPVQKDASDMELAIKKAIELNPQEIIILGALGKRIDHIFANMTLLTLPLQKGIKTKMLNEYNEVYLINEELQISGGIGDYISIFALTADAKGVTTSGLKYQLNDDTLYFNSTRGLSNELAANNAEITLKQGYLLIIKKIAHKF